MKEPRGLQKKVVTNQRRNGLRKGIVGILLLVLNNYE
jgi:hypothetical protein